MPKVGMKSIRRHQLVEATLELIHEQGVAGTSVSQISARAGLATGMVHHYFADKDALLEATLRELNKRINAQIFERLRRAQTPIERVLAFIDGNVSAISLTPENAAAWLAFWSQVPYSQQLQRIHNVVARRSHSTLFHALARVMPSNEATIHAKAIAIFIDGLWLRASVDAGGLSPESARHLAYEFLTRQLGQPLDSFQHLRDAAADEHNVQDTERRGRPKT
jgi:TetR/AcrR family transcriptional regulator, transcriptional repressor of bet genes